MDECAGLSMCVVHTCALVFDSKLCCREQTCTPFKLAQLSQQRLQTAYVFGARPSLSGSFRAHYLCCKSPGYFPHTFTLSFLDVTEWGNLAQLV